MNVDRVVLREHRSRMATQADMTGKCATCKRDIGAGERHRATTRQPSLRTLERWSDDGIAHATDGCKVEPDGKCEHGHSSWLLRLGYI